MVCLMLLLCQAPASIRNRKKMRRTTKKTTTNIPFAIWAPFLCSIRWHFCFLYSHSCCLLKRIIFSSCVRLVNSVSSSFHRDATSLFFFLFSSSSFSSILSIIAEWARNDMHAPSNDCFNRRECSKCHQCDFQFSTMKRTFDAKVLSCANTHTQVLILYIVCQLV